METSVIQLCTYQKNIDRYKGLLKTKLSDRPVLVSCEQNRKEFGLG